MTETRNRFFSAKVRETSNSFAPIQDKLAVQIQHLNFYFGQGHLRKQVLSDINLDLPSRRSDH